MMSFNSKEIQRTNLYGTLKGSIGGLRCLRDEIEPANFGFELLIEVAR